MELETTIVVALLVLLSPAIIMIYVINGKLMKMVSQLSAEKERIAHTAMALKAGNTTTNPMTTPATLQQIAKLRGISNIEEKAPVIKEQELPKPGIRFKQGVS